MLEQQIYSIESANINQETLVAMKNAGAAMKQIHGNMKMEDVDNTMYGLLTFTLMLSTSPLSSMGALVQSPTPKLPPSLLHSQYGC